MWIFTKWKSVRETLSTNIFFLRKFEKWKIYFRPSVLAALKCYFGDNVHKTQTSFKTIVSKNAATWRLHQNLWVTLNLCKN